MLNKELLMAGATGKEPHILMNVIRYYDSDMGHRYYGYNAYSGDGEVSKIPCWGRYGTMANYTALEVLATREGLILETMISFRNPYTPNKLEVKRLDTGKFAVFEHDNASASTLFADASLFWASDIDIGIPLIFDPPPRLLFGSRYRQTDLGIGYYVEEVPWEAQDAEQGTVNGTEPELQPSLRHPRVLRRTQQRDGLHLDFSRWNFKDRWCFRRARGHSRNAYLQTKHQCLYPYRQLQRGLHSYPTTGYHSNRGVLRALLNIHSIQRCRGILLVSYRGASYA